MLVEVVGYLFSRLRTEECDLHWILVATSDPHLPAVNATALRQECNVIGGYLGPPETGREGFAVNLTARIEDVDSATTVMWQHYLNDFADGVLADFLGGKYRQQDSSDEEGEEVTGKVFDREEKIAVKKAHGGRS